MKKRRLAVLLAILGAITVSLSVGGTVASAKGFGHGLEVVAGEVDMIKTGLLGKTLSFSDADLSPAFVLPILTVSP